MLTMIVKHGVSLSRCFFKLDCLDCTWISVKEKHPPITNLNILLYQTNLDYRCNHQSIQVKLEQNSRFNSCKVHYYQTNKHYMVHKYTAEEK